MKKEMDSAAKNIKKEAAAKIGNLLKSSKAKAKRVRPAAADDGGAPAASSPADGASAPSATSEDDIRIEDAD